ncbi:MAG: hypothetical protein LBS18_00925 [Clostridiales bacterium]|jgi:hypothetical protein|nr:hypothetical protein [Clostridiales bacterium]
MKKMDLRSMKQPPESLGDAPAEACPTELRELVSQVDPKTFDRVRGAMEQLQGKSRDELMEELIRAAAQERMNGNLSDERVDTIGDMIAPMLNPAQRAQAAEIMRQIKTEM